MIIIGIIKRFFESREQVINEQALDTALRAALSGATINENSALSIPAVSSTVSFIAGAVATLPIRLYKTGTDESGNPVSTEVLDDYRLNLLNLDTGDLLDANQWKTAMVKDYFVSGNGYTYVNWIGNRVQGLYYIDPTAVSANIGTDHIFKTVTFLVDGNQIPYWKMLRILRNSTNGVTGTGFTYEVRTQLETMLNALNFENRMVRSGGKKGFLKAKSRLAQNVIDDLKAGWKKLYGNNSEETVVILNDGVEFQDAGTTAVESQLNENKQANDHEVYKLSGLVPAILEGGATQEDRKNTVRFAIAPVVKALETAINRFCLLESEKGTMHFEIDLDALDGTDMLDRYQAYESGVRAGWIKPDEVRHSEGMNNANMDFLLLGLNNVIYNPTTGMVYTPNTKEWTNITQKGGTPIEH